MDTRNHADFGAIIPAFLDEYPLDPFEFRLFARIQRRSGRKECFESLPNMAKGCHMSLGKARLAFRVLAECKIISIQSRAAEGKTYLCTINPVELWVPHGQVATIRKALTPSKSDRASKSDTPIKSDTPTPIKSDTPTPIGFSTTPLSDLVPPPLSDLIPEGIQINESKNESHLIPPTPQRGKEGVCVEVDQIQCEESSDKPSPSLAKKAEGIARTEDTPEINSSAAACDNNTINYTQHPTVKCDALFQRNKTPWLNSKGRNDWNPSFVEFYRSYLSSTPRYLQTLAREATIGDAKNSLIDLTRTDEGQAKIQNHWDNYQQVLTSPKVSNYQPAPDTVHQPKKPIKLSGKR